MIESKSFIMVDRKTTDTQNPFSFTGGVIIYGNAKT